MSALSPSSPSSRGLVRTARDPLYRFLSAAILSQYGDWLTVVALVVVVVRVTGSPAAPAGYMLARTVPRLVGAAPGGVLADRHGGARVVAVCSVLQAAFTAAIIPAEHAGSGAAIFVAIIAAQLVGGISRSALGTVIPGVVPPSRIGRANALYGLGVGSSLVVGPALGAPLFLLRGPDLLLAIDAGTFVVAALLMVWLPVCGPSSAHAGRPAWAGVRAVAHDPALRALAAAYLSDAVAITVANSVLVLAAIERLGGEGVVGLLYAAVGTGDAIGAVLTLRRRPPRSIRLAITTAAAASIVALAIFSAAHAQWLAVVALVVSGAGTTSYLTWGSTDMQERVASGLLGRVNVAVVLAQSTGTVVGAVVALVLVPLVHWDHVLFIAACCALALLAALVFTGPTRQRPAVITEEQPAAEGWRLLL